MPETRHKSEADNVEVFLTFLSAVASCGSADPKTGAYVFLSECKSEEAQSVDYSVAFVLLHLVILYLHQVTGQSTSKQINISCARVLTGFWALRRLIRSPTGQDRPPEGLHALGAKHRLRIRVASGPRMGISQGKVGATAFLQVIRGKMSPLKFPYTMLSCGGPV